MGTSPRRISSQLFLNRAQPLSAIRAWDRDVLAGFFRFGFGARQFAQFA
jgi:hypothetical protein